jgi:hypothetical protein
MSTDEYPWELEGFVTVTGRSGRRLNNTGHDVRIVT